MSFDSPAPATSSDHSSNQSPIAPSLAAGFAMQTRSHQVFNFAGIPIANLTQLEAFSLIDELISAGGSHYAAVVNASKIVAAQTDEQLHKELRAADFVTADGMSVVWASRLLGGRLQQRVTGIDLFEQLIARAAERGHRVYLLGASRESVEKVVERFTSEHPTLEVAGYRDGYFSSAENEAVVDTIRRAGVDLLFVALGSPAQEHWIAANLKATGARFALGVGGSFDHLSGLVPRAPQWMRSAGLEWLHRLAQEPGRLWRRYLIGNTKFIVLVAKQIFGGEPPAHF